LITVDRNRVTNPNTMTVIRDQNGRSTMTSTERPVMNASCSRTARMRSADIAIASRDLQEHVLERWLTDVDVQNADSSFANVEDRLWNILLLSCHGDGVVAFELDILESRVQRREHLIHAAFEGDA